MISCRLDASEFDERRFDGPAYVARYARSLEAKDRILSACGLGMQSADDAIIGCDCSIVCSPNAALHEADGL